MVGRESGNGSGYGWVMVAIAPVFLAMGSGAMLSISMFVQPLEAEFGWQRGEIGMAYMAASLAFGVGGLAMGALADRYSVRPLAWLGALSLGALCLLLSRQQALWQFVLLSGLVGGLSNAAFSAPLSVNVSNWFLHRRGLALGLMTAGHMLGQGLVMFVARLMIGSLGWRMAYASLGLAAWGLLLPLSLLVRSPPPAPAVEPGRRGTPVPVDGAPPAGTVTVWLGAAMFCCCICMASPCLHLVSMATDKGIDATTAAGLMMLLMFAGCVGRIAVGCLADRVGGVGAYWMSSFVQTLSVFWFTRVDSLGGFASLVVPYGISAAGIATAVLHAVGGLVPAGRRALAMAVVTLCGALGMGIGGLQGGLLYDATGSYAWPFAISALGGVVNLALLAALAWHMNRLRALRAVVALVRVPMRRPGLV